MNKAKILNLNDDCIKTIEAAVQIIGQHYPQARIACLVHIKGSGQITIISTETKEEGENMVKDVGKNLHVKEGN